jgi:hypothetical protein
MAAFVGALRRLGDEAPPGGDAGAGAGGAGEGGSSGGGAFALCVSLLEALAEVSLGGRPKQKAAAAF